MIKPFVLPYKKDALEPHISEETIDLHFNKHYLGYVKNTNKLIHGTVYEKIKLEEIVKQSSGVIFNNAAQVWNHVFYFNCMTPAKNSQLDSKYSILAAIEDKWESLNNFKEDFVTTAGRLFGSGWTWLVWDTYDEELSILNLPNADNPLTAKLYVFRPNEKYIPLLVCDGWEHSFYTQYPADRNAYLNAFWKLINWEFVEEQFQKEVLSLRK